MQFRDLIPWGRKSTAPATFAGPGREVSPIFALHREIERAFDEFWSRFEGNGFGFPRVEGFAVPAVDVVETDKGLEVTVDLPGLEEKDVDLALTEDTLTIRGEKKEEREEKEGNAYLRERSYGAFYRAIPLPAGIDADKAEATFRNGVLKVMLPR
ncbi:MAG: Hsp20/alpha crystallin family protein, partial [Alphaproteobacteria bacterium]